MRNWEGVGFLGVVGGVILRLVCVFWMGGEIWGFGGDEWLIGNRNL